MVVDQDGSAPKTVGAQFTYTPAGGPSYFLVDNGSGDSDPSPNVIRKTNLLGSYNVCQTRRDRALGGRAKQRLAAANRCR